ncbi:hypothetical protein RIF29_05502 [Crotalaria pallida]|uniref:Uncharacterized protein n=1 Tax=Crotalaria pallida TaxID=3830 RepID=A0AAN9J297_CROPI
MEFPRSLFPLSHSFYSSSPSILFFLRSSPSILSFIHYSPNEKQWKGKALSVSIPLPRQFFLFFIFLKLQSIKRH